MANFNIEDLQQKIAALQKDNKVDLSSEEDLSIAIMNLISLEEHFFFSGAKTGKTEYYDLLNETREIRKELLGKLMDQNEAESWCVAKHLLAATMRMMEVGTKYQKDGKKEEAEQIFQQAFRVYSLFWALRLKIATVKDLETEGEGIDTEKPWTAEDIVNKLVNCCKE